jgi:transcriptional regulator GlxA family with amidase domain
MDERVRTAIAFMNTNLHRKLTPIEIAESVRFSPTHLCRLFKDETGKSVARYRRELQLERAKHLLETTFLGVKVVAGRVDIRSIDTSRPVLGSFDLYTEINRLTKHALSL